jgi:hypothetical protein
VNADKPLIYIASPYTLGDRSLNTEFQMIMFNRLILDGIVWPIAPLWSHFQHEMFPLDYNVWLEYDFALIARCDAGLRLGASIPEKGYEIYESKGADLETLEFDRLQKPVFYTIESLYDWVETFWGHCMPVIP